MNSIFLKGFYQNTFFVSSLPPPFAGGVEYDVEPVGFDEANHGDGRQCDPGGAADVPASAFSDALRRQPPQTRTHKKQTRPDDRKIARPKGRLF